MRRLIVGAVFAAIACGVPAQPPTLTPEPTAGGTPDRTAIQRLEQEARVLANTSGCTEAAQCRALPVGTKACGGPRYYLPYCPLTTDAAALQRKLDELRTAEQQFNAATGAISDCMFISEPSLTSAGGACQAR